MFSCTFLREWGNRNLNAGCRSLLERYLLNPIKFNVLKHELPTQRTYLLTAPHQTTHTRVLWESHSPIQTPGHPQPSHCKFLMEPPESSRAGKNCITAGKDRAGMEPFTYNEQHYLSSSVAITTKEPGNEEFSRKPGGPLCFERNKWHFNYFNESALQLPATYLFSNRCLLSTESITFSRCSTPDTTA